MLAVPNSELVRCPQFFEYGPRTFFALYIVARLLIIAILWLATATFVGTQDLVLNQYAWSGQAQADVSR